MPLASVRSVRSAVATTACGALPAGLLVGLIVIQGLADATLPDPAWISGMYDGGDYDHVCGAKVIRRSVDLGPSVSRVVPLLELPLVASIGSLRNPQSLTRAAGLAFHTRAPPRVTPRRPPRLDFLPRLCSTTMAVCLNRSAVCVFLVRFGHFGVETWPLPVNPRDADAPAT